MEAKEQTKEEIETQAPVKVKETESTNPEVPAISPSAAEEVGREETSTLDEIPVFSATEESSIFVQDETVETSTMTDLPAMNLQPTADTDNSVVDGAATLVDLPALNVVPEDDPDPEGDPPTDPMAASHNPQAPPTSPGNEGNQTSEVPQVPPAVESDEE
ncbi:MAG TPA: hypothetical protein DCE42_06555 [Myxococcales bacterium]|nr:hypothetical protein [Deltaproteobacteria bacterium]HAA54397.1 hypothetical protein [Myxococcales bacterium]|tara:strand:+ start:12198 stop:12677 length:480 start_codon:yes stop_codon:yes gene_type:complete